MYGLSHWLGTAPQLGWSALRSYTVDPLKKGVTGAQKSLQKNWQETQKYIPLVNTINQLREEVEKIKNNCQEKERAYFAEIIELIDDFKNLSQFRLRQLKREAESAKGQFLQENILLDYDELKQKLRDLENKKNEYTRKLIPLPFY